MARKQKMKKAKQSEMPVDIILEMLARLPAKSLCRFRCVSKAWRALISDPTFVAAQRSIAGPHLVGVFFGSGGCRWPPEVRVMDMDGNVVRLLEVRVLGKDDDNVLGVLQQAATTRRFNVIIRGEGRAKIIAMVIDPAAGRAYTVGTYDGDMAKLSVGRAATSGAFKVLLFTPSQICKVATIVDAGAKQLRWREKSSPPFFIKHIHPIGKATVNGVIYFLLVPNASLSSSTRHIAAFDLESEDWKMINGPALGIQENTGLFTLTEHKGTLGLVQHRRGRNDEHYYCATIWLLIDFNKSLWVKENTIQMPSTWKLTKLLGALDDGIILLFVNELEKLTKKGTATWYHYRDVIVFYNPSTKTFTKFKVIERLMNDILFVYTGSLLS